MPEQLKSYNIQFPQDWWKRIRDLVTDGKYRNMAHFFREAIIDKLQEKENER